MLSPRRLLSLIVAAGALAALPAAAHADSIVYIDGGNVFSAHPDGSGKVQLTDGGQWHSPTQADDGTIAAVQGTGPIVVMARDGRVLRTIQTPGAKSGDGGTFAPRPVELAFSPDGSKIAYSYVASSCPVASSCGTIQASTFYTRADASPNATPIATWGNQFSVSNPAWVTNDRALVFGGSGHQVNLDTLDSGEDYNYAHWFDNPVDTADGELSRDGRRLAALVDYGADTKLGFWSVDGDAATTVPAAPKVACTTTSADERFADVSWSPDGSTIAFADSDGIETMRFTAFEPGQCATDGGSHVIFPGASEPDWGPADPPAARYLPPATTPASTTSAPAATTGRPAGPAATVTPAPLTAGGAARQRFRGSVTVQCTAPVAAACTGVASVRAGRRTYRSKAAVARVGAGKTKTLRLVFGATARKAITKALRQAPLRATVTLTAGGAKATRAIALRR